MFKKEREKVSFEIQDTEEEEETVQKVLRKNAKGEYISHVLLMIGVFFVSGVVSLGLGDVVKGAIMLALVILALAAMGTVNKKSYNTRCYILEGHVTDKNNRMCTLLDTAFNLGITVIITGILIVSLMQLF